MFFGRKKELKELELRYRGSRKEFGIIYGRRRIGKSALVRYFFNGKRGIFFQAKQDTSYGNLRSFSFELNKLLGLPVSFVFSSWQEAFDSVLQAAFYNLPDQVLSNSTKVQDVYNAILRSIAHRHYTLKDISTDIHEESSKVSKYISTLLKSEIIAKRSTFMGSKNSHYYVISDPLLRFWYLFIYDEQELIKINGAKVLEDNIPLIKDFVSRGFEDTAILFLDQENIKGNLPELFPEIQNFKEDNTVLGRSVEIDGLSRAKDTLLVVECKYRNKMFTNAMLEHLIESASIFTDKLHREYYVFSKSGFSGDIRRGENIHLYTADSIFTAVSGPSDEQV